MKVPKKLENELREQVLRGASPRSIADYAIDYLMDHTEYYTLTNNGLLREVAEQAFRDGMHYPVASAETVLRSRFQESVNRTERMPFGEAITAEMHLMERSVEFEFIADFGRIISEAIGSRSKTTKKKVKQ